MANEPTVSNFSDPIEESVAKFLYDNFCRHLVCLTVRYSQIDKDGKSMGLDHTAYYTFFVASVKDQWFLVTAGHVLKELEERIANPQIKIEYLRLIDFFGERDKIKIPTAFDFNPDHCFSEDNKELGLDFGFIPVLNLYKQGLIKNGIVPIDEGQWMGQFDPPTHYFLLGFPEDLNVSRNQPFPKGEERMTSASPVMVSVEPINDPSKIPESVPKRETKLPRWIGKITGNMPFKVKGMSGGPIFGINTSGGECYSVVAMQNSCHQPTGTIFGCPIKIFGGVLVLVQPDLEEAARRVSQ